MGVRHHRDLEVWQLANRLRRSFHGICGRPAARADAEFRGQTSRAGRSACRNIAEGFWRFGHREFAHFVNIAKGEDEYADLNRLLDHALRATTSLQSHLVNTPTPERRPRDRTKHDHTKHRRTEHNRTEHDAPPHRAPGTRTQH